jgi:elongation factor G
VPREFVRAVEKGVKDALGTGVLAGYPVMGVRVTLIDGSFHTVDSSDIAFEQAATVAIKNVLEKAGPVLLEPIMRIQVEGPKANFGAVQASLLAKRGFIIDSKFHGKIRENVHYEGEQVYSDSEPVTYETGLFIIDAKVPLSEMFGYSSEIRSVTAGRGTFTMEPCSYERVPGQIAERIII